MKIIAATNHRESAIDLLKTEKMVVSDLPKDFKNFIVALQNEKVIGVAGLEIYDDYGFLRSVAIKQHFRSKGIANELIKQIEKQAAAAGLKEIYLLTETAPEYLNTKVICKLPGPMFRRKYSDLRNSVMLVRNRLS